MTVKSEQVLNEMRELLLGTSHAIGRAAEPFTAVLNSKLNTLYNNPALLFYIHPTASAAAVIDKNAKRIYENNIIKLNPNKDDTETPRFRKP